MECYKRIGLVVALCLLGVLSAWQAVRRPLAPSAAKVDPARAETAYPNCRFGVTTGKNVQDYDVASLNVGWYLNWGTWLSPPHPGGAEYMQMVRLEQVGSTYTFDPPTSTLLSLVDAHPGGTWLIGNEPDGYPIAGDTDSLDPRLYTRAYHQLHTLIKGHDPEAQIAIGPVIQPTLLRFEYLDTVWDTYYRLYGETMPVDIWNIHSFILRETTIVPDPEPCENTIPIWGAYVPRGSSSQTGELYCIRDQDNLAIFWERIRQFRQWMAEKGEREKPLIITEFGVLFPEDYADEDGRLFSQPRVGAFMTGSFDLMLSETDPDIGYPYDDNRLVQRWAWFSLDHTDVMGGGLFDPDTKELRMLGQYYQDYTSSISPTVDLQAVFVSAVPPVFWYEDVPVTARLEAIVSNVGNISSTLPYTATFYDGPPGEIGTNLIDSVMVDDTSLAGCGDAVAFQTEWTGLEPGVHSFYVEVQGGGDELAANNVAEGSLLVAQHRVFLPKVLDEY